MAAEFGVDFTVLEHLRGYPDELRRYSSLMKQSDPRGQYLRAWEAAGRPWAN